MDGSFISNRSRPRISQKKFPTFGNSTVVYSTVDFLKLQKFFGEILGAVNQSQATFNFLTTQKSIETWGVMAERRRWRTRCRKSAGSIPSHSGVMTHHPPKTLLKPGRVRQKPLWWVSPPCMGPRPLISNIKRRRNSGLLDWGVCRHGHLYVPRLGLEPTTSDPLRPPLKIPATTLLRLWPSGFEPRSEHLQKL